MPPKIYYSDEEKRKDELKKKQRGTTAPKVIKTTSAKATAGKNTTAPRRTRSAGSVKMEVSVASNGSNPHAGKSTAAPQKIKSGKVTIARTSASSPRPTTRSTVTIPAAKAAAAPAVSAKAVATRRTRANATNATNNNGTVKATKKLTPLQKSIETARSVVANPRHPKHDDVKTLLESHQKQFITDERFIELLKNLLF